MVLDLSQLNTPKDKKKVVKTKSLTTFKQKLEMISSISAKDKIFFVQNLQVMIKSGLALDRSLNTLASQTKNKRFKAIISDMAESTEKGISFAESLRKHEKVFGQLFVNMVKAGEVSGRLEEVLKQIYVQIKKVHELKSKIISAMTYPVIVIIAMVGIGIGMMIFVVPKMTSIFNDMDAELPFLTRFLINFSNFLVGHIVISTILLILIILFFVITIKYEKTKYYFHVLFLKLPIVGSIVQKINMAKFCRTLSSLIKTDIPIIKSFEITSQILGNRLYRKSLLNSIDALKSGETLTEVLNRYPKLFPPVIIQMTAAGEETGTVDEVLGELASFYEDDIDQIMKTLPSIIEPILILVLGSAVGVMAVAIILPMQSITQHIN